MCCFYITVLEITFTRITSYNVCYTKLLRLKKLYDVVVIDSPPIGLVTDAHLLTKYSDVNILVTRHDSTPKPMLRHLLKDPRIKDNGHFCLLLNDFPFTRKGYGYGYNSDYYKN